MCALVRFIASRVTTIEKSNMKFTVSEQVKKETVKCKYNFSCLESGMCGDNPLCVVHQEMPGLLTLKAEGPVDCPYLTPFGNAQFCTCPVHLAIIKKYGQTQDCSCVNDPL